MSAGEAVGGRVDASAPPDSRRSGQRRKPARRRHQHVCRLLSAERTEAGVDVGGLAILDHDELNSESLVFLMQGHFPQLKSIVHPCAPLLDNSQREAVFHAFPKLEDQRPR